MSLNMISIMSANNIMIPAKCTMPSFSGSTFLPRIASTSKNTSLPRCRRAGRAERVHSENAGRRYRRSWRPPCRYSQLRITVAKKIQHTKLIFIQYSKSPGECQYEVSKNCPRRIAPGDAVLWVPALGAAAVSGPFSGW